MVLPLRRSALPHGNVGLAGSRAGSRDALWEGGKMAAPMGRTLLGVARGWRRLDSLWASSPRSRRLSLEAAPSGSRSPWRLLGALCLQRPPLITKPLTPLQQEMADLLQKVRRASGCFAGKQQFQAGFDSVVTLVLCVTLSKSFHLLIFSDISKMEVNLSEFG